MAQPDRDPVTNLFLIDDHELIRRALVELFTGAGFRVVGEADTVARTRSVVQLQLRV